MPGYGSLRHDEYTGLIHGSQRIAARRSFDAVNRLRFAKLRPPRSSYTPLGRTIGVVASAPIEPGSIVAVARVLIIDDDPTLSEVVARYLEREGFEVSRCADGNEGLRVALENLPDLVVLDLMLPGIDGFEVFRRLREVAPIPVVMLTARGEEDDRVAGLELGADDYVAKPFSPRELTARVRAVLRRANGGITNGGELTLRAGSLVVDVLAHEASPRRTPLAAHRERVRSVVLADAQPQSRVPARGIARDRLGIQVRRHRYGHGAHAPPTRKGRGRSLGASSPVHRPWRRVPVRDMKRVALIPAGVLVVGARVCIALALSVGTPLSDAAVLLGSTAFFSIAVALASRWYLARRGETSLRNQILLVSTSSVATVVVGTLAAARAMFISVHDLNALFAVMTLAVAVAVAASLNLAGRFDTDTNAVTLIAQRLVDRPAGPAMAGGFAIKEMRDLACRLDDVSAQLESSRAA